MGGLPRAPSVVWPTHGDAVVFLGAGASHGARISPGTVDEAPPLGDDLAGKLLDWLERQAPDALDGEARAEWRRLVAMDNPRDESAPPAWLWSDGSMLTLVEALRQIVVSKGEPGKPRFEATIDRLVEKQDLDTLVLLNRAIALFVLDLAGPFAERRDLHDTLVSQVSARLLGVVSVNYDLLFEEALVRACLAYSYPEIDPPPAPTEAKSTISALKVFKLHGSCNWFQTNPIAMSADEDVARRGAGKVRYATQDRLVSTETDDVFSVKDGRANAFLHLKQLTTRPPILATYGQGKPASHSRDRLDRVRAASLDLVAHAQRCVIIGVRPPKPVDDPATDLLVTTMAARPERLYVSPCSDACEQMKARGFRTLRKTLEQLLHDGDLLA